ncbi:TPA: STAS/SEC14 domain-containing protein [Candidatus Poribacteria bacterium]|nr:STAS/SEC14 domain-containing protein [Candidatus Poribacteria bacterium]
MAVVEVSSEQLLKAVVQLPQPELEQFLAQVLTLRPRHAERRLSQAESELLLKINQGIPADLQRRYNELIGKRQNRSLTPQEYEELLQLTDQVELLDAKRVEYLLELAQIRNKPLTLLMEELGIHPPEYA